MPVGITAPHRDPHSSAVVTSDVDTGGASHQDAALVLAALTGDTQAIAVVYDEHAGPLYRLAICLLGSAAAAEKVVANVLVVACTVPGALNRFTGGPESLRLALVRLTHDRCRGVTQHDLVTRPGCGT